MTKQAFIDEIISALQMGLSDVQHVDENPRGVLVELASGEEWELAVRKVRHADEGLSVSEEEEDDDEDEDDEDDDEEEDEPEEAPRRRR